MQKKALELKKILSVKDFRRHLRRNSVLSSPREESAADDGMGSSGRGSRSKDFRQSLSKKDARKGENSASDLISLNISQIMISNKSLLKLFEVLKTNETLIDLDISNKDGAMQNSYFNDSLI